MYKTLTKNLSSILSVLFKIYTVNKDVDLYKDSSKKLRYFSKILKIPSLLFNKLVVNSFLIEHIPYSHARMIRKRKYILSLKSFYSKNLEKIKYQTLFPKSRINFNEIETKFTMLVNTKYPFRFKFGEKNRIQTSEFLFRNINFKYQREIFFCTLTNIKFIGISGIIFYKGLPLVESADDLYKINQEKMVYSNKAKPIKSTEIFTSIMHWDYANNHYHFIIDNLPRLYAILKINEPKINLIVPKYYNQEYLAIVKLFLDERFKLHYIKPDEIWEIERYFFPSFCSNDFRCLGYIPKKFIVYVKEKLCNALILNKNISEKKRIYISRNKAKRKLLNENKLMEILKKYNFTKIYAEDLSFKEQVNLFNSASIIIGPSGAGLTNLIFSENSKVVELHPPKRITSVFFMLCKALGFEYKYVIGYENFDNYDFRVDIAEVETIVKEMIQS